MMSLRHVPNFLRNFYQKYQCVFLKDSPASHVVFWVFLFLCFNGVILFFIVFFPLEVGKQQVGPCSVDAKISVQVPGMLRAEWVAVGRLERSHGTTPGYSRSHGTHQTGSAGTSAQISTFGRGYVGSQEGFIGIQYFWSRIVFFFFLWP